MKMKRNFPQMHSNLISCVYEGPESIEMNELGTRKLFFTAIGFTGIGALIIFMSRKSALKSWWNRITGDLQSVESIGNLWDSASDESIERFLKKCRDCHKNFVQTKTRAVFTLELSELMSVHMSLCWVDLNDKDALKVHQDLSNSKASIDMNTYTGHLFVLFRNGQDASKIRHYNMLSEIPCEDIIMLYQPLKKLCSRTKHQLIINPSSLSVSLSTSGNALRSEDLVNSANKKYLFDKFMGFKIFYEEAIFKKYEDLYLSLKNDLETIVNIVPKKAILLLQESTSIWINSSLSYGPKSNPISGRNLCFHVSKDWLLHHGMNPEKQGCIEIYNVIDYLRDRLLWGAGGLLLHEFSHAWHFHHLPHGYDCRNIILAYRQAMQNKLYDDVEFKTFSGFSNGKAYASSNHVEYFAEISVAFLCVNPDLKLNKWFPYNRSQLELHDPFGFSACLETWGSEQNNDNGPD